MEMRRLHRVPALFPMASLRVLLLHSRDISYIIESAEVELETIAHGDCTISFSADLESGVGKGEEETRSRIRRPGLNAAP